MFYRRLVDTHGRYHEQDELRAPGEALLRDTDVSIEDREGISFADLITTLHRMALLNKSRGRKASTKCFPILSIYPTGDTVTNDPYRM